jgi:hypothetical protein
MIGKRPDRNPNDFRYSETPPSQVKPERTRLTCPPSNKESPSSVEASKPPFSERLPAVIGKRPEMPAVGSLLTQTGSLIVGAMAVGAISSYGYKGGSAVASAITPPDAGAQRGPTSDAPKVEDPVPSDSTQQPPKNTKGVPRINWSSLKNPTLVLNNICQHLLNTGATTDVREARGPPGIFEGIAYTSHPARLGGRVNLGAGIGPSKHAAKDAAALAACQWLHEHYPDIPAINDILIAASSK